MAQPDYSQLIDAETWAFIRATEAWYPPDAVGQSVTDQRAVYDRMCKAFDVPYPAGVIAEDRVIGGVGCRDYRRGASDVTVVYFHGGGSVVGGLHSHDAICADICGATGFRVVAADYRLSPEHHHPAAFDDARAVTRAVAAAGGRTLLAGDSAGGTLAAAVAQATRGEGLGIVGQALIYPGLGGDTSQGSYLTHADAPMLTRADILYYGGIRHPGGVRPDAPDPTAAPLDDTDFSDLPPTLLYPAECDPHCDDALVYARHIRAAGGRAHVDLGHGLVHAHLRARHSVVRARAAFARICDGISHLGAGLWPYEE